MGNFNNTKYINTINSLIQATSDKLINPYYMYSDKKPTPVNYWAQDQKMSTLDEASSLNFDNLGNQSPLKFNLIKDFVLYGIERITLAYEAGDYGLEAGTISGEAIALPNTITPVAGDYFCITYLKEKGLLFKVDEVTKDTLDTGANIYKFNYHLEKADVESYEFLLKQTNRTYLFSINNVGTELNPIILDSSYQVIEKIDAAIDILIDYFNTLFFKDRLQTFIYPYLNGNMYDPYMIEFLKRNKILENGDKYVFVDHATTTPVTFVIDYIKTFFYSLEQQDLDHLSDNITVSGERITDVNSLFYCTINEEYFKVIYNDKDIYRTRFPVLDLDVINHIREFEYYEDAEDKAIYNIWIAFFNGDKTKIDLDLIDKIKRFDYMDNVANFYGIPITIYILKHYANSLMS